MSSSPPSSSSFASSPSASPSASAYLLASRLNSFSDEDEVASLPSVSASDSSLEGDFSDRDEESDAEREWKESIQQLELLLTMVIIPFAGKFLGRKCAYWGTFKFHWIDILLHPYNSSYSRNKNCEWKNPMPSALSSFWVLTNFCCFTGWAKMMEWKYPVEIVVQNKAVARCAGVIEAAASLWQYWEIIWFKINIW